MSSGNIINFVFHYFLLHLFFKRYKKRTKKMCRILYGLHFLSSKALARIIFSRIFIKPLKSLKYRATRKTKNIFIMQYGIKTADSAALSVLFLFYSEKNAISSRWKSLNGTERNLFAYIHTRNRGKYFWFSSRVYLRISHLHTLFA